MKEMFPLTFKLASEPWEFEQIHQLNYRTFVEEIPQHHASETRALVDKFDRENTYAIAVQGDRVVGMMAMRGQRPFSLDKKLSDLDCHLPAGRKPCEVRLLAVEKTVRGGAIFRGILKTIVDWGKAKGFDLALISGVVAQQRLYQHIGFVPFGPLVGTNGAQFQPMYLTLETWEEKSRSFLKRDRNGNARHVVNLLPGPVGISKPVRDQLAAPPVSHRSDAFVADFQTIKTQLCTLVGARHVEILTGSGTLANDAVAAQLSLLSQRGLVLSNGEFGERLKDHATRWQLNFKTHRANYGEAFDSAAIEKILIRDTKIRWLWAVHCETSTGVLNDLVALRGICAQHKIRLCLDCIGSVGTVSVDLKHVYLSSAVSGKGIGAFPGVSMVFYNHTIRPASKHLPRYLDLGYYAAKCGIPFTASSNYLYALQAALQRFATAPPFADIAALSTWLRPALRERGFEIVGDDANASPAVITIALPKSASSEKVGDALEREGFLLSYKSDYLLARNWIQICLMGECSRAAIAPLLDLLPKICSVTPSR